MSQNPFRQSNGGGGGGGVIPGGGDAPRSGRGRGGGFGGRGGGRGRGSRGGGSFGGRRGGGGSFGGRGRGSKRGGGSFGGRGRGSSRGGGGRSFGHRDNSTDKFNAKEEEWGKVKFNPNASTGREEEATPWSKFKNEIVQQQRDEQKKENVNINNDEAKQFIKQRNDKYKKMVIAEKQKEPTKWEDFNDEPKNTKTKITTAEFKKDKKAKKRKQKESGEVFETTDTKAKKQKQEESEEVVKTTDRKKDKKAKRGQEETVEVPETIDNKKKKKAKKEKQESDEVAQITPKIISQEQLENFNSKEMTFAQKNHFRKVITKTTNLARGASLSNAVKDMKRQNELKRKKFNQK